jgi:hypothetical protein
VCRHPVDAAASLTLITLFGGCPMSENTKLKFAQLAVQYYVAGRAAAICQLIPVLGNLLHHAIEMSLKAALAEHKTLQELKKLSHSLPKIWAQFKSQNPNSPTAPFDGVIVDLQKFEELRYPDSLLVNGAQMEFYLFEGDEITTSSNLPVYVITLEKIDNLMALILEIANLNPCFFVGSMGPEAKSALLRHNRQASIWVEDHTAA